MMKKNRMALLNNLSNQANACATEKTKLTQMNILVLIGLGDAFEDKPSRCRAPLSVTVDQNGDMEIHGVDGVTISDDHIRVYTDRKVTRSPD